MKGPGVRFDQDVRRFWRCSLCGKVTRSAGQVTTMVCLCTGEPRWMHLEPTPRRPRYVPPSRELEPVEDYTLPPDPPRAKTPVAVAEPVESPNPAPFGDGLELLAAESGLVIETEFRAEPMGDQAAETPASDASQAPVEGRGSDERRPPRGPRPPRGDSRERPPRPGQGGGRPQGGRGAGPSGLGRGERGGPGGPPARSGRRPDRPGAGPRREHTAGPPSAQVTPEDAESLAAGPAGGSLGGNSVGGDSQGGEAAAGGSPGVGAAGGMGGSEGGSVGSGRRRRRGGQRDGQSRGGDVPTPVPGEVAGSERGDRPERGLAQQEPAQKGPPVNEVRKGRPRRDGGVPPSGAAGGESQGTDDTSAELSGGTEERPGRRQRRRRRGGARPAGPDTSTPGQSPPEGTSETFGEGLG